MTPESPCARQIFDDWIRNQGILISAGSPKTFTFHHILCSRQELREHMERAGLGIAARRLVE